MKKLIMILMAAAAFSCGDGSNRSSERENDGTGEMDNTETVEPSDTSSVDSDNGMENDRMQSDTTSTMGRQRDVQSDSLR